MNEWWKDFRSGIAQGLAIATVLYLATKVLHFSIVISAN